MGDKNPKSKRKQDTQKESRTAAKDAVKEAAIAAKKVPVKK
ncbi:MAG: hypothetical protein RH862_02275 [Leptospiraceae bacterium]